jgi:hypothetical protein
MTKRAPSIGLGLLAAALAAAPAADANAATAPVAFTASATRGVSLRQWQEPNRYAKSGAFTFLELRNDLDETVWFRVGVWVGGQKRMWTAANVATGQTYSLSIDASRIERIEVDELETQSQRRRKRDGNRPPWETADVIFPKGTRSVRFHLDDPYTYASDRRVHVSMFVAGNSVSIGGATSANLGWGVFVLPDAQQKASGRINSDFYFGVGQIGGVPLTDGAVWELEVRCDASEKRDFFGLAGLDGAVVIESPRPVYRNGVPRATFKVGVGGRTRVRFSVAPN